MVSWYIFVATGTHCDQPEKMTAERGSPKGKCLVQCQRKSFASFLLCHAFTLFSHMWQPAYLDKKAFAFHKPNKSAGTVGSTDDHKKQCDQYGYMYMYLKTYAKFTFCIKSQRHVSDENILYYCRHLAGTISSCSV